MADVVCIGTAIVDCIIKGFDDKPVSASGYFASSASLAAGGEALNQAVTATKLGLDVRLVCGIGTDAASDILLTDLIRNNVSDRWLVRNDDMKTPVTVMFVDDKANRQSITNEAHRFNFRPDRDMAYMDGAKALSIGSLFRVPFNDPEIIYAVISNAKKRGMTVFADTKLPNCNVLSLDDLKDSLPMIDYIFPNENEGKFYSGCDEPEGMADAFLEKGVKCAIVKLGGDGCLMKNASGTFRLPVVKVNAVDATGAGDNFGAGFVTAKNDGMSDRDALMFANVCGAISTTTVGATTGIKDRAQVDAAYKEYSRLM